MTVAEDWQPVVDDDAALPFRRRLLDGLAASIGERGYRDTTVADIVRHARTSKRTFYGEFSSKEECFIELLAASNQEMIARIRGAVDPEADWRRPDPPGGRCLGGRYRSSAGDHAELDTRSCRRLVTTCAPFSAVA